MLSVVFFYGFLALKEEYRLNFFEDGMLRKIFGPKREEITGDRKNRKMTNFTICCPSRNMIQFIQLIRIIYTGHVTCMGGGTSAYRVLVGKCEVKRKFGILRRRWRIILK
jgi:hypothetical protein